MSCVVCARAMRRYEHYARCPSCDYWSSDFVPDVENTSAPDEVYELGSYEHTRRANYETILALLAKRHSPGSTLLEIGCADGLFLAMARAYQTLGIEPNARMANGNPFDQNIRAGFFPDVLEGTGDTFDIIALNCVFEHLPDVDAMIESMKRYLAPGGSISILVPLSSGPLFKVSRALHGVRVRYPFERIWQRGFVSPHLHYFTKPNLVRLFGNHGLSLVADAPLALYSLAGLGRRLDLDPTIRPAQRLAALGGLVAYYPLSRVFPDVGAFVFAA